MDRSFDNRRSEASSTVCCESTRSFTASVLEAMLREQGFTARVLGASVRVNSKLHCDRKASLPAYSSISEPLGACIEVSNMLNHAGNDTLRTLVMKLCARSQRKWYRVLYTGMLARICMGHLMCNMPGGGSYGHIWVYCMLI